ncbi:endonuclease/exonuclease/phosphatase family protein [Pseudoalteromonas shioyasakiensis]|uniref:endonuclease/exonuclease/phosphatase family protein n=1 Tax=Pseudoalteromonas shioyasakiensis TaxID=1190813 RepID=UPI0021183B3B|nr:endonuclease/exonuclease/phosphatase family protein [Pseudoalteromonas shioyasakiensis]MCQ8876644.1 endonuclease/exonuclease/phosphatase family protein [Pseudoalteromonas shioyasakiensis]
MSHRKPIRIASLNLLNFAAPPYSFYQLHERYNATQWRQKQDFIRNFLINSQADIVAFQEVFSIKTLEVLCKEHGYDYFETVAVPSHDPLYPQVLFNPVVAIAAKIPIMQCQALTPCTELLEYLNNQNEFKFNRTPIKCSFTLPELGTVYCYVVHFKSQRVHSMAHMLNIHNQDDPLLNLLQQTVGMMQSQISRSLEASIVYYDALKTQREKNCATIVMGDFNDSIHSPALSFMTQGFHPTRCEPCKELAQPVVGLTDAFNLSSQHQQNKTKAPSHYYQGRANVLDYILVSGHFNSQCVLAKVDTLNYISFNDHLKPNQIEEDICTSDHGGVAIEIGF